MLNVTRLVYELKGTESYDGGEMKFYEMILEENGLDPVAEYDEKNDRINLLESVYKILQVWANNPENYIKIETEFTTVSAAYQHLQKRLKDIRAEIDRLKLETRYLDRDGNETSIVGHMFYNSRF